MSNQHRTPAAAHRAIVNRTYRPIPRMPRFVPVPIKPNGNAFLPRLQAHFLGFLAESGSVSYACAMVQMSRQSAYRLRKRAGAESFNAAWDAALGRPYPKVTSKDLQFLAFEGAIRLHFRAGRYRGFRQIPCDTALLRLIARLDKIAERIEAKCDTACRTNAEMRSTMCDTAQC